MVPYPLSYSAGDDPLSITTAPGAKNLSDCSAIRDQRREVCCSFPSTAVALLLVSRLNSANCSSNHVKTLLNCRLWPLIGADRSAPRPHPPQSAPSLTRVFAAAQTSHPALTYYLPFISPIIIIFSIFCRVQTKFCYPWNSICNSLSAFRSLCNWSPASLYCFCPLKSLLKKQSKICMVKYPPILM